MGRLSFLLRGPGPEGSPFQSEDFMEMGGFIRRRKTAVTTEPDLERLGDSGRHTHPELSRAAHEAVGGAGRIRTDKGLGEQRLGLGAVIQQRIQGTSRPENLNERVGKGRIERHRLRKMGPGRLCPDDSTDVLLRSGCSGARGHVGGPAMQDASVESEGPANLFPLEKANRHQDPGILETAHKSMMIGCCADLAGSEGTPKGVQALHGVEHASVKQQIASWQAPLQMKAKGSSAAVKKAIRSRPTAPATPIQAGRPTALAPRETTKARPVAS